MHIQACKSLFISGTVITGSTIHVDQSGVFIVMYSLYIVHGYTITDSLKGERFYQGSFQGGMDV